MPNNQGNHTTDGRRTHSRCLLTRCPNWPSSIETSSALFSAGNRLVSPTDSSKKLFSPAPQLLTDDENELMATKHTIMKAQSDTDKFHFEHKAINNCTQ